MYIGIDCGTQGTKAILWENGNVLGHGYTTHSTKMDSTGQREQDPTSWFRAMTASIEKAFLGLEHLKPAVKGIGVSGQQHGLVLLDDNKRVIRDALLWCDTRPDKVLASFVHSHQLNFFDQLGIQVPVAFTLGKLLWVKQHDPVSFKKISMIMLPHDYLNWCLTGRFTVEAGDSSGTGWFDTRSKSFSQKILEWVQFEHPIVQPDILESHEVVANLHPKMAKQLGLRPDVLVSSGGGDNMMAAIGTGNVGTGQLTISLGTSGTLFSHSLVQVDSEEHPDLNVFCSSTNGYLPLSSTMNVTTANNQILDLLNTDISQFDALLNASQLGANGLVCLPFFNGARLPNVPKANGAILGITASNMTRSNMLRATVEGVTYNLRKGAEVLMQAGVKFENACIIGGGANSPVWKQIISDTLNLPLWTPKSTEAAAFGAATQACWARENQHQHISISDLCADTISIDERLSVEPNKDRYQRYESEFNRYQLEVERHMAQFV